MRIKVEAFFDGVQWEGYLRPRRTKQHVDVVVYAEPRIDDVVQGHPIDRDPYDAQREAAEESFDGTAWIVVGRPV